MRIVESLENKASNGIGCAFRLQSEKLASWKLGPKPVCCCDWVELVLGMEPGDHYKSLCQATCVLFSVGRCMTGTCCNLAQLD